MTWKHLGYVAALTTVLTLVACGSDTSEPEQSRDRTVTVDTVDGPVEVTGTPSRIVAFGQQWVDALREFDVQPVGYVSAGSNGDERGLYPWQTDVGNDAVMLDASAVEQGGGGAPTEQIAALRPDLILVSDVPSSDLYQGFSDIAPTIFPKAATVEPWESQIETLGKVLDREDDANRIIAEGHQFTDGIAADLPGLDGKTAVLSIFIASEQQLGVVADPEDGSAKVFASIGLGLPEVLANSPDISNGRLLLSPERLDMLTSDLLVMLPIGGTRADREKLPGFSNLPAVRNGGLAVVDYPTVAGINLPSKASVEFSLNKIRPQLEAVGG